ncbi:rRNA methyltransferase [Prolixibacter sp. NT017]|uniref:methyltransferase RsmF C-terminal domain-like protein n=1 Tax=Prolixibacter sp. NT017 TaxID=2652390 RepID=UPI0012877CBA|nr:rRNA methyltransferase [Prolixibacter sp. NT017]GET24571.1 rRNA cytosine-C5-methyltransferase [Prolixibacter sp. NT017]
MATQLPESFTQRMQAQLGDEFEAFQQSLSEAAVSSIRVNSAKSKNPVNGKAVPWCQTGFYLDERPFYTLDPFLHAGVYYVQEASSMFLEQAFCQLPNEPLKVLDLCGAPGGKSTHIVSLLPENSLLVSNEVIRSRAVILSENLKKWGNPNIIVTNNDPKDFATFEGQFDVLVVDAPCSGEGLFRRDENAIAEWSPENTTLCAQRQQRILADVWPALKPGGVLIYSTCTYNPGENEENLKWLNEFAEVENTSLPVKADWGVTETEAAGLSGYRFYPHKTKGEGFFMAVVRKLDGETSRIPKKLKSAAFSVASSSEKALVEGWLTGDNLDIFKLNEALFAFPSKYAAVLTWLQKGLRIVHAGVKIGEQKKKEVVPVHELALSPILQRGTFPEIELTLNDAIKFLHRDEIRPEAKERGWHLLTYQDIPLGWAKNLGNRFNSNYPKEWRIRMDITEYMAGKLEEEKAKFPIR